VFVPKTLLRLVSFSSSDFLSNLLVLLLRVKNAGLDEHGLSALSHPIAAGCRLTILFPSCSSVRGNGRIGKLFRRLRDTGTDIFDVPCQLSGIGHST
jgi:hypothetical protein